MAPAPPLDDDLDMDLSEGGPPDPIAFLRKLSDDETRLDLRLYDSDEDSPKKRKAKKRVPQDPPARERPAVS